METVERTLYLNGTIAEESSFDDDVTPQMFKDELQGGSGDITGWINSPGGDCVVAAQIYNMLREYKGNVTVKIDGIAVGQNALEANIRKAFDVEGAEDLGNGTFSDNAVEINAATPENGKAKFTVTPKSENLPQFFFKVKLK